MPQDWILVYLTCSVLLIAGQVKSILVREPSDVFAVRGSNVSMSCYTNLSAPVAWELKKVNGVTWWQGIYKGVHGDIPDVFEHKYCASRNFSLGQHNLTIRDIQPEEAGTYRCVDHVGFGMQQHVDGIPHYVAMAEVVVVDEPLKCGQQIIDMSLEQHSVVKTSAYMLQIHCNITYRGSIPPTFNWSLFKPETSESVISLQSFANNSISTEGGNSKLSSEIILLTVKDLNQSYVTCEVSGLYKESSDLSDVEPPAKISFELEPIFIPYTTETDEVYSTISTCSNNAGLITGVVLMASIITAIAVCFGVSLNRSGYKITDIRKVYRDMRHFRDASQNGVDEKAGPAIRESTAEEAQDCESKKLLKVVASDSGSSHLATEGLACEKCKYKVDLPVAVIAQRTSYGLVMSSDNTDDGRSKRMNEERKQLIEELTSLKEKVNISQRRYLEEIKCKEDEINVLKSDQKKAENMINEDLKAAAFTESKRDSVRKNLQKCQSEKNNLVLENEKLTLKLHKHKYKLKQTREELTLVKYQLDDSSVHCHCAVLNKSLTECKERQRETQKENDSLKLELQKVRKQLNEEQESVKQLKVKLKETAYNITDLIQPNRSKVDIIGLQHEKPVSGVTVVGKEIFVVRNKQSQVNVYNSVNLEELRSINIPDMKSPEGLAGCAYNRALYISDARLQCIHRVDLTNNSVTGKPFTRWDMTKNHQPYGLSVTAEHTLLATVQISGTGGGSGRESRVVEYRSEGQQVREIKLDRSIEEAWHTVQLSSDQFIVSLGWYDSSLDRICVINAEGRIIKSFGREEGRGENQLFRPSSLAIDEKSKHVFVADTDNNRVLMLDSELMTRLGEVRVSRNLSLPTRLYIDSSTDRLFVGEYSSGRLFVISPQRH